MKNRNGTILLAALLFLFGTAAPLGAQRMEGYALTDLGALRPSDAVTAAAINDAGQVTGTSGTTAFLWQKGRMTGLGTRPNARGAEEIASKGYGINAQGMVVGSAGSYDPVLMSGFPQAAPFLWTAGRMRLLDEAKLGNVGCEAFAINRSGVVVGVCRRRGFRWFQGKAMEIGTLSHLPAGNDSWAAAVNDAGVIVGQTTVPGATRDHPLSHAFAWRRGRMQDLGTLPGAGESHATAINAQGWIVGASGRFAALWQGGRIRRLGPPANDTEAEADGINAGGVIVGTASRPAGASTVSHACLWRQGAPTDLNALLPASSGWVLESASAINARGQIVGSGLFQGKPRAFLMTPGP